MASNTCENVVGRVLEIRLVDGYDTPTDIDAMLAMIGASFARVPASEQVIIAADWRAQRIMDPPTAARAQTMLTNVNPRVLRSAILTLPEQPTTNMQVVRLIREAQNAERQHFTDVAAMRAWLQEVARPDERARLEVFLAS